MVRQQVNEDTPCATPVADGWCGHQWFRHHPECMGGEGCPCEGFTPPGRAAHHVGVEPDEERFWRQAVQSATPKGVAFLLLECSRTDGPTVVRLEVDGRAFEIQADRLMPILRADMARRQRKSREQVGRGT